MKPMEDKEIDQVFRDRFANAEIEPSVDSWANIKKRIAPEKKSRLPVFWIAAASVVVFFTALFFIRQEPTIYLRTDAKYTKAVEKKSPLLENQTGTKILPERNIISVQAYDEAEVEKFKISLIKDNDHSHTETPLKKILVTLQPTFPNAQLSFQETAIKPLALPNYKVNAENRQLFARVNFLDNKDVNKLGKIVNFVVDKLDKRDKKLIVLGSDSDGGIAIVGVNLGFIKWNSPQKELTLFEVVR